MHQALIDRTFGMVDVVDLLENAGKQGGKCFWLLRHFYEAALK